MRYIYLFLACIVTSTFGIDISNLDREELLRKLLEAKIRTSGNMEPINRDTLIHAAKDMKHIFDTAFEDMSSGFLKDQLGPAYSKFEILKEQSTKVLQKATSVKQQLVQSKSKFENFKEQGAKVKHKADFVKQQFIPTFPKLDSFKDRGAMAKYKSTLIKAALNGNKRTQGEFIRNTMLKSAAQWKQERKSRKLKQKNPSIDSLKEQSFSGNNTPINKMFETFSQLEGLMSLYSKSSKPFLYEEEIFGFEP